MTTKSKSFSFLIIAAFLVFGLGACKSKKTAEDTANSGTETSGDNSAPQLDSTPMNFDAAGSDSGNISGLKSINFEYDKAALTADAKKRIQGNVEWLKGQSGLKMQIEGHCDSQGINRI